MLQDDAHDQRLRDKADSDEWQATLNAPPGSTSSPAPSSAEPRTVNSPDLAAAQASGALEPADVAALSQALDRLQDGAPRDPVTVTNLGQLPLEKLQRLSTGAVLPVKVDTVVPGVVAVDWQAF